MHWFGSQTRELCTIGFAYQHPQYIDWGMTGFGEQRIYKEIDKLVEQMDIEGKPLTARQREILEL